MSECDRKPWTRNVGEIVQLPRRKPHFVLRFVQNLCDATFRPVGAWKPFCAAHNCWPCGDCGTAHYPGCACVFCIPAGKRRSVPQSEGRSEKA